jgi:chromosome segregation ATPase
MEAMPQSWNDDRLDDLNVKVDRGFEHVERRFEQVDRRFEKIDERFEKIQEEFVAVRRETKEGFDGLHRTLVQIALGFASLITALFGVIATQL